MVRAYLKINTRAGWERKVQQALVGITGVLAADQTAGEQDIICLIKGETYENLLQTVLTKIRKIDGITGTITNLILD